MIINYLEIIKEYVGLTDTNELLLFGIAVILLLSLLKIK